MIKIILLKNSRMTGTAILQRLTQVLSTINLFIPSVLAVVNIAFISNVYSTIVVQNARIIDLLSAPKDQILTKIPEVPTQTIISTPEISILNTALPYAFFIGSIVVCGVLLYFHYTSGGHGTPPPPNYLPLILKDWRTQLSIKLMKKRAKSYLLSSQRPVIMRLKALLVVALIFSLLVFLGNWPIITRNSLRVCRLL